jgi:2-methylcitrate dehydratase PrpD
MTTNTLSPCAAHRPGPAADLTAGLIGLLLRPVGPDDRLRAALHLIDWLGCAAAGSITPPGQVLRRFLPQLSPGPCRSIFGVALAVRDAVLVDGAVGNVLEMDDFHRAAIVHPGPVVVPVAWALGQHLDASAGEVLDAIVRGFEAMIRIGRCVGPAHYRFFHNTATCGVFGAAAAAASLLKLSANGLADALGNAGTQASGLWQCRLEDTMSKQLHNGRAAQSGLLAAQLATLGFTGAHQILEGPLGFFNAMCPDGDPARLLQRDPADWLIHETSFKPWPACRHAHATIDCALALRGQIVDMSTVRSIEVATYRDAVQVCDRLTPLTPVQAKFSLQHASAVVLARGRPTLADFDLPSADTPELVELRSRVRLVEDPDLTAAYPNRFGARMKIELSDGRRIEHFHADALGDPERPLSRSEIEDKASMLLIHSGRSSAQADRMIRSCLVAQHNDRWIDVCQSLG